MLETPDELDRLQHLLDDSMAGAGHHLRDVIEPERRLDARQLVEQLTGMRLLVLATVTADGRPVSAPVDGYFLHGAFWFSLATDAVRTRHLEVRPQVSATHLPGADLAVTVHGRAALYDFRSQECAEMRRAMFDHYAGPDESLPEGMGELDAMEAVGARLDAEKMFTFHMTTGG